MRHKIQKTKTPRLGDAIDERIKFRANLPVANKTGGSIITGATIGGGGSVGGGGGDTQPEPGQLIQVSFTVAAAGGTTAYDFGLATDYYGANGWITCSRPSYTRSGTFSIMQLSGSASFTPGISTGLPVATPSEYTLAGSIASGSIRLTVVNNNASEDLTVLLTFKLEEQA